MKFPANGSFLANSILAGSSFAAGIISSFVAFEASWFERGDRKDKKLFLTNADYAEGDSPPDFTFPERSLRSDRASFAESGPQANIQLALSEWDPALRSELLHRAGREGARQDVAVALTIGLELKRTQDQLDYYRGLYAVWSDVDPQSALDYAKRGFHPGMLQTELISLVMNKWGFENPQKALVWAKSNLSGPLLEQSVTDMMIGWTRRNPKGASSWITNSDFRSQPAFAAVATTWAEQNPEAAAFWATQIDFRSGRRGATLAVTAEWTRQDPEVASEQMLELAAEDQTSDIATLIADIWGTSDPEAAALWVATLPEGPMRDQAAGTLASVWATRDIYSAVAWSETISDPSMRSRVINHLGTTWGGLEPESAITWLSQLEPDLALPAMEGAFNSWAAVGPDSMRDWIENSEITFISDQARRSLADVLSQDNAFEAIEISLGITDAKLRNDSVARYFRYMRKTDEASAQEWASEILPHLPEDLQQRIQLEQRRTFARP